MISKCEVAHSSSTQCYGCKWKSGGIPSSSSVDLPGHINSALQGILRLVEFEMPMPKSNHTNNVTTPPETSTENCTSNNNTETSAENCTANSTTNTTEATTTMNSQKEPTTLEQCQSVDTNVPKETCRTDHQCSVSNKISCI